MKQQEKGRGKLDIRVLFTLAAIAEILGTLLIATLLTALLENLLHEAIEVHPLVWLLLFGTTIGLTAATVVNVLLLRPVVRLSRAMKQVASGNFAVRHGLTVLVEPRYGNKLDFIRLRHAQIDERARAEHGKWKGWFDGDQLYPWTNHMWGFHYERELAAEAEMIRMLRTWSAQS